LPSPDLPGAALTFAAADRDVLDYWFTQPDESPSSQSRVGQRIAAIGLVPQRGQAYSTPAAFVASLVLNAIRHRLPGEDTIDPATTISQQPIPELKNNPWRRVELLPRFLCSLNWESRGPESCWPVDYYATWLPGYYRWVVTGSCDAPEYWGAYDVALGWFDDDEPLLEGTRGVLTADWRIAQKLYSPLADQFVGKPGAVQTETAERWMAEVGPERAN